jgi:uncharacterized protein involved in response to NO
MIPHRWRAEPYRILFPLGVMGAIVGMGSWIPHALWPGTFGYPGLMHAVVQIQGFLLCFIFGFLCTMLPKVLGVPPLGTVQYLIFPAGLAALTAAAIAGAPLPAQLAHLVLLANFALFIARRWSGRRASPPPFFVFIAAAMAADLLGTGFRVAGFAGAGSPELFRFGALLQYQAFPLMLIMGVGGFLLPKLFGGGPFDPSRRQPAEARPGALWLAAGIFVAGFALEAWRPGAAGMRLAAGLRTAVWAWFLLGRVQLHRVPRGRPAYLEGARWSLWAVGAGLLLPVAWPEYRLAWEHIVFVAGYLWITVSVAARVLTAHGGRLDLIERRRPLVRAYGGLFLLAAATRAATDLWIDSRNLHLAIASGAALAALAIWAALFGPLALKFPAPPAERPVPSTPIPTRRIS